MSLIRIKRTLVLGAKSLWMHRLRSTLTALGIIFGVCSVIAMLAIGEGASRQAQEQIARLGSRNIIIKTVRPIEQKVAQGGENTMHHYGLTYDDAEHFRHTFPNVQVVVPLRNINEQGWYRNRRVGVEVIGTVPWYTEIAPINVREPGRFLSSIDVTNRKKVCVVDEKVIENLFVVDDPIGKDLKIKDKYYRVVGVVGEVGPMELSAAGGDYEQTGGANGMPKRGGASEAAVVGRVYVPLTTFKNCFGEISFHFSGGTRRREKIELQEITVKVQETDLVLPMRDALEELLGRTHEQKDYQIEVPLELLRQVARTKRIFSIVLGSIAAISLLVGGIGIMNIMLASVSERTREIGIRRAMGARRRDIIVQFLVETVMLTLAGGVFGMILGVVIPHFVTRFTEMPTVITGGSLVLAFGISGTVGLIFGLYPAQRAANMDPIESLRHE